MEVKKSLKPVNYVDAINFLESRIVDVLNGKKDELLWILEHNSIYTAGTSAKDDEIIDKKIKVEKTNRGGKITYHGPGQKVVYFVLNLNNREKNIKKLVNNLEECIIEILKDYKIISQKDSKNIGIWVHKGKDLKKIAAIGIRVKKWIAYHGFSINVSNDLKKYEKIVPCGIKKRGITSMKEMGVKDFNNIDETIINKFLNVFP
tara:strand:- start:375 stop:986 length:612 start_codon:yes stop_codon:yes gene_type:complete